MRKLLTLVAMLAVFLAAPAGVFGQETEKKPPPLPPLELDAHDFRNDHGGKVIIGWLSSMDDPNPTLPTIILDKDAAEGGRSPKEQLEYDVDRNRFKHAGEDGNDVPGWYDHLRLSVKEMLAEEDRVLAMTFRLYVSGIVRRHLDKPTVLGETLAEPDAWFTSFVIEGSGLNWE